MTSGFRQNIKTNNKEKKVKIKKWPNFGNKKVYYFEHRHGVVAGRTVSGFKLLTSLMVAMVVMGGSGLAVTKVLDFVQDQKQATSYQRQGSVKVDADQEENQSEDKHKTVSLKAREDEALAKDIKSKLKNIPGGQKWSVYVRDVKSDRMASINADDLRDSAGLEGPFMAAPLETKFPAYKWNYRAGKQSIEKCVELLISHNDKDCRQIVSRYIDLKNADSVNHSLGFKKTTITDKKQQTTAREVGDLLFRLQHGQVISDKARRVVFDGLYSQRIREGIPTSCTDQCLIANAVGEGHNLRHEAAIVTSGNTQYVVVIMTSGGSWSQIADLAAHIRLTLQP